MDEIIQKYSDDGIGFSCSTHDLKELKIIFERNEELLRTDLKQLEDRKNELNKIYLDDSALDIVKKSLKEEELKKIDKEINLILIAIRFKSMEKFLEYSIK